MNKKRLLVIIGSARQQGDTKAYVDYVFDTTEYTLIDLSDYHIAPYQYQGEYPAADTFNLLTEDILNHDIIIFATPVYWYAMSGSMKALFDRFTDLVTIQKMTGRKLKGKQILLLAVGSDADIPEGFEIPFKHTAVYLGMQYHGAVYFSTSKKIPDPDKSAKKQIFIDRVKKILPL